MKQMYAVMSEYYRVQIQTMIQMLAEKIKNTSFGRRGFNLRRFVLFYWFHSEGLFQMNLFASEICLIGSESICTGVVIQCRYETVCYAWTVVLWRKFWEI